MKQLSLGLFLFCALFASAQVNESLSQIDQLINDSQYEDAHSKLDRDLAATRDDNSILLLQNKKAELFILQGNLDEAERLVKQLKERSITSSFLKAITLANSGFLYLNKGRSDVALEQLQEALTLFQQSGNGETKEAAQCLSYLGSAYIATGKYNQAKDNELRALQIRQKLFGEMSEAVAASYNDLGLTYATTDNDKALEYYDKALPVYEQMHGKNHPKIAIANTNMGVAYRGLELYGDAIVNFEAAIAIWKKIYPNGHPNEAFVLSALGETYVKMGESVTAETYFRKALALYKKSYGNKHPGISATLNQLGILKLKEEKYDSALIHFQNALISNTTRFTSDRIETNPKADQFYNGNVLLYSMRLKAQALESRYHGETLKLSDLKVALSTLHSCDTLIDILRQQSQNENDKLALSSLASDVYEDGVRIAASVSTMTIDYNTYRLEAFYFIEKSKSAVLQEAIAEADAKSFSGIPSNLLEEEKNIKSAIALLVRQLAEKPSEEQEQKLRTALFTENAAYVSFTKKLEQDYPEYFNLKFNQLAPSVAGLQKILDNRTAVISYFIAEQSKRIYMFIITKKRFQLKDFTLPEDFERNIKGFTNSILYNDIVLQTTTGKALYKLLIPRLPSAIHDLVIIPSGRLGTLPFEALTKKTAASYSDLSFLIEKFAISYEFSSGLLIQKAKAIPSNNTAATSIFLCAPVNFPDNVALNELPGTVSEVNTISNLFAGSKKSVALFKDANESLVKSNALSSYTYLHFATHGIVDEEDPELSKIFLNSGNQEDGNLFSGEIYNLDLNAEMVVLSACQTGLGKFSKGEGVIGLSRALIYAGAKNIIVSFWSVADQSTAELMVDFYKSLLQKKDQNYREALQQAKVNMIKQGTYSAPYYWAPFVMIGF